MTPTKLLIGQILVVFVITIAGVWAATQWLAAMLAFQPELGLPWFRLLRLPVYHPWALFDWWYHFDAYAPRQFEKAGLLAGASGFLGFTAAVIGSLWRARQSKRVTTYGSARWASKREVVRAGLFRNTGRATVSRAGDCNSRVSSIRITGVKRVAGILVSNSAPEVVSGAEFITADEFAVMARLSRRQIDRLRKRRLQGFPREYDLGSGSLSKFHACPRFRLTDVERWLDSRSLW